ncbi:hypothetical protein [Xanthomonas citri]|uniref:hypothetical protein n=1 Tax=Xanthomonas citri TaxID=346 RepID=UPI0012FE8997|nr:hypothetical protein [Xanthomonas citri]
MQYLSTHQSGLYPHSGSVYERGVGNIHNLLLPPGSDGLRFRNVWEDEMLPLVDAFRPQLILISAGFDAHLRGPTGRPDAGRRRFRLGLTGALRTLADRHARGRVVSILEGGYDLQALRESSVAHVAALR